MNVQCNCQKVITRLAVIGFIFLDKAKTGGNQSWWISTFPHTYAFMRQYSVHDSWEVYTWVMTCCFPVINAVNLSSTKTTQSMLLGTVCTFSGKEINSKVVHLFVEVWKLQKMSTHYHKPSCCWHAFVLSSGFLIKLHSGPLQCSNEEMRKQSHNWRRNWKHFHSNHCPDIASKHRPNTDKCVLLIARNTSPSLCLAE